jgi:hypothetical protein
VINGFQRFLAGIVADDFAIFRTFVEILGGVFISGDSGFGILALGRGLVSFDNFGDGLVKLFGRLLAKD